MDDVAQAAVVAGPAGSPVALTATCPPPPHMLLSLPKHFSHQLAAPELITRNPLNLHTVSR